MNSIVQAGLDAQAASIGSANPAATQAQFLLSRVVDDLLAHDTYAERELQGVLAASERSMLSSPSYTSQNELDGAMVTLLSMNALTPGQIFVVWQPERGGPPEGERENAYLELRTALAHALAIPTHEHFDALAKATIACARMGMKEIATAAVLAEREEAIHVE